MPYTRGSFYIYWKHGMKRKMVLSEIFDKDNREHKSSVSQEVASLRNKNRIQRRTTWNIIQCRDMCVFVWRKINENNKCLLELSLSPSAFCPIFLILCWIVILHIGQSKTSNQIVERTQIKMRLLSKVEEGCWLIARRSTSARRIKRQC